MMTLRYFSLFLLISLFCGSSSQAMTDVPSQKLTPKICNKILLEPDSNLKTCDICLKQVLRTSLTRAEYVQTLNAQEGGALALGLQEAPEDSPVEENPNPDSQIMAPESSESSDEGTEVAPESTPVAVPVGEAVPALAPAKEENPTLVSQITAPESSDSSHEDAVVAPESAPVAPVGGAVPAVSTENESDRAPLLQNTVAIQPIIPETERPSLESAPIQTASAPVLAEGSSDPKAVIEAPSLPTLVALPTENTNIVLTPQPAPVHQTPSKESASPTLLSSHEIRALQDHLPDPVLQRTRAVQATENSISSLVENVRGDQEKINTLREKIEKNKAIIAGEIPLPAGATLRGLQSRIEVDGKNMEAQENQIQSKTKEIQTLEEKTEKLQGEIHAILKGDAAKGVLASRYASALEGKQGDIVRKQATHDLSVLAYNEAQQAYAASVGVPFGFGFPIEQQMKNQRLVDHLFSLAEQLREDDPDNHELAEQLDLQAQQLKDITPARHQKKSPEIRHKKK